MTRFLTRLSGRTLSTWLFVTIPAIALIVAAILFFDVKDLCAHSPHDPIDAIALSPVYDQDQTLFIILSDQLLRSTDGGASWKRLANGLDYKTVLSDIQVSPDYDRDRTVFASSKGQGIYRSQDGGDSWTTTNDGLNDLNINLLAIHPVCLTDAVRSPDDPAHACHRTILAAGTNGGLYRTEDNGDSWTQVVDQDIQITALTFSPNVREDADGLTATAFFGGPNGILYRSIDGGQTWHQVSDLAKGGEITALAVSPDSSKDSTLFVGTQKNGIWKSTDGGSTFAEANGGLPFTFRDKYGTLRESNDGPVLRPSERDVISIAVSPDYARDSVVFATLWNQAAFKSDNGGKTWKRHQPGLVCDYQADSETYNSPHFRDVKISNAFATDQTVFLGGFAGLFKSTDGGRHWAELETLPVRLVTGLALSGEHLSADYDSIPTIAMTTYGGGVYTWDAQREAWVVRNNGLTATRLTDITFSSGQDPSNTLFSASYGQLLKLVPDKENWVETKLSRPSWRTLVSSYLKKFGVPGPMANILLTESEQQKPYATMFAVSPNFAADNTLYFGTRRHGIFRSADGGRNASVIWEAEKADGSSALITSLVISPNYADDETLFAGVYGMGIYKTIDKGATWHPMNQGLTFVDAWQSPAKDGGQSARYSLESQHVRVVISPGYGEDQTVFAASGDGLFKTTDGADNWQKLQSPTYGEDAYVVELAISPDYENDQTLIISVKGRGLFKSEDGGFTFAPAGSGLIGDNHQITLIEFSPAYATSRAVYAASDEELFRSTDGGETWQTINRPVRYEDMRQVLRFDGQWQTSKGDNYSARTISHSDVAGSKVSLQFVGTGTSWLGMESSDGGIARVYIDGTHVGDVDQFGQTERPMIRSFSVTDLAYGPHTITVEASGHKNPESAGHNVYIDAFDVLGTSPTDQ